MAEDKSNQEPDQDLANEKAAKAQADAAAERAAQVDGEEAAAAEDGGQGADLAAQLEEAQAALAEAKEQVLRSHAEAQNVRRRAEQDVEKAHKFALEKFTNELLPVIDSLERAVESCNSDDASVKAIREGVEMTLTLFMSTLQKFNVEPLNPEGEPFDPQLHQAMSMVENPEVEPNTVIAVMQKGYLLNGRLVRPAMVMVSKAAAGDSPKIDEQA